MNMISYGRQDINEDDIAAVVAVLRSDWLTQGPMVPRFEQAVAEFCGADHGVAVNSGTSALHLACLALGLGPGDVLWTSPITFVASANCALYCGASVDFVDVDPVTCNLDVQALEAKLIAAERSGRLPKIVVPVHFAGQPCDMAEIQALGERFGFAIVDDASHALGAQYRGDAVGNGEYADITVFSFHPVKPITSGEGGMAVCRDAELAETMRLLRTHGITKEPERLEHSAEGPWYYEQIALGFNYRLSDLHAALGLSQVARLPQFIEHRRALAERYDTLLEDLPVTVPARLSDRASGYHLYPIRLQGEAGQRRGEIFAKMRSGGIGVQVHYIPVYRQPAYRRFEFSPTDFPAAEAYYASALTIPLYPTLTSAQQERVITTLAEALT